MSEAAPPTRPIAAAALGLAAGAVLLWLVLRVFSGGSELQPPVAELSCLDVQHRPNPEGAGPSLVHLGVVVAGPAQGYRAELVTGEEELVVGRPDSLPGQRVVLTIPVDGPDLDILRIDAIAVTDGDDRQRSDITEDVLGPEPWVLLLGPSEGPLVEDIPQCAEAIDGRVHPGFVFAPPSPAFASQGSAPADGPIVGQIADFLSRFAAAHAASDTDALVAALHPAAIDGYGDEICRAHIADTVGSLPALDLVSTGPVSGYQFVRPGGVDDLDEVVVVVEAAATTGQGQSGTWRFNLVVDGAEVSWLSWCGN